MTPPAAMPVPPADAGPERPVTMAGVTGAHGIAGEVRLKVFADDLDAYRSFNGGALTMERHRNGIARFAEIADRNAAEALRGTALTVPRSALPPLGEGEFYHVALNGLPVRLDGGEPNGRVNAVENFGAGDLVEVEKGDGERFLVPLALCSVGEELVAPAAFAE